MTGETRLFEQGLAIRREVLGSAHVDRSISNATDFNRPMQELVTEYCWGAVWSRPGLERKTRSLLNIAMLTALNQHHELGLHVEGALRNGASSDEIREVLLQAAIYCGVPAAVAAFRTATEAIARHQSTEGGMAAGTPGR
jgi:4-carboxymuconolactone decarboxylase